MRQTGTITIKLFNEIIVALAREIHNPLLKKKISSIKYLKGEGLINHTYLLFFLSNNFKFIRVKKNRKISNIHKLQL